MVDRAALVVLLRGVNVGGHRRFRPASFAAQWPQLGLANVGATGTFVVRRRVARARLRAEIARRLPFAADIFVCAAGDLVRLSGHRCFAGQPIRRDEVRFLALLARAPRAMPKLPLELPDRGPWLIRLLARQGRFVLGVHRRRLQVLRQFAVLNRMLGEPMTIRSLGTIAMVASALARTERLRGAAKRK
ncbi:MAG: DUF1697 domain-containing protein [Planctomycetes bacterium]|nr:DUF1697 domain-containing protein [Planctomycetota bacterium]